MAWVFSYLRDGSQQEKVLLGLILPAIGFTIRGLILDSLFEDHIDQQAALFQVSQHSKTLAALYAPKDRVSFVDLYEKLPETSLFLDNVHRQVRVHLVGSRPLQRKPRKSNNNFHPLAVILSQPNLAHQLLAQLDIRSQNALAATCYSLHQAIQKHWSLHCAETREQTYYYECCTDTGETRKMWLDAHLELDKIRAERTKLAIKQKEKKLASKAGRGCSSKFIPANNNRTKR